MKETISPPAEKPASPAARLLQSGVIFSVISFATGLVNFAFQGLISRRFKDHAGEFGFANNTTSLVGFFGLPLTIATTAVTHYIAHYKATGNHAQLRGLLLGCRRILFGFTLGGTVLAMALIVPLAKFFNIPRPSLVMAALVVVMAGLWGSFATALCQGLSWFKRLAIIGFIGALMRWVFTWIATDTHPIAEVAVVSTAVAYLANLVLIYWRKEIFQHGDAVSPWNRELMLYLVASAACVGANTVFLSCDQLVAQKHFGPLDIDHYSLANRLAIAVPQTAAPLLVVLFTSRSGSRTGDAVAGQIKLLGLYALGLVLGLMGLLALRGVCMRLIAGTPAPEAEGMLAPLALTLVFGGLLQSLGMWALASRWLKVCVLYGVLSVAYWGILLQFGTTPEHLLGIMPWAAGGALAILLVFWLGTMKAHHKPEEFR